jgi:sialic acid synthase SpsE
VEIIAEICQNHNGSIANLKLLAESAHKGGARYAKIQALYSNDLNYREDFENPTQDKFNMYRPFSKEFKRLKMLDLSESEEYLFVEHCKKIGIIPMITVFTKQGIFRAKQAGFEHIKIASYDSTNTTLIESSLEFAKSLFISTGATTKYELENLVSYLKQNHQNKDISLLHCKTIYPNQLESVNLNRMLWMKEFGFKIGFSDHTKTFNEDGSEYVLRNLPSMVAINLGASVLERHFTNLGPDETKDGRISINEADLLLLNNFMKLSESEQKTYLNNSHEYLQIILGNQDYDPSVEEWWNRKYYKGRVI